jgi:hypothetical protein
MQKYLQGQDAILGNPAVGGILVETKHNIPKQGEIILDVRTNGNTVGEVVGFSNPAWRPQAREMQFFVTSRGGEYFFVPSILLVREIAGF